MINRLLITVLIFLTFFTILTVNTHPDETRGRELFEEKGCVRCHTIGRGKFVGPDLLNLKDKYSEEEIISWIVDPNIIYSRLNKMPVNQGYPPMPNFNVSESDAREITDFLINNKIVKSDKPGGDIRGKVINKSTDNIEEGIDIYLQSFIGDRKTGEKLLITDENGGFNFKDLSWDNSYSIKIKSSGIEYETAKMVFPPDRDVIELELPIFDTIDDNSVININLIHQVITIGEDNLSVAEIYEFENRSNRIFIGKKETGNDINKTLKFYIPKKAENIGYIEGISRENILRRDNVAFDTVSFPPGKKRVVITYDLPISFGKNRIDKDFYYNTNTMLLLAAESKNKITVTGLNELDPIFVDNQNYLRWVGDDIKSGSRIGISFSSTKLEFKTIELYPIVIFGLLFAAAVIIGLVVVNNKNRIINSENLTEKRKKIITEIAQLDIRHENDEIDSDEYKIIRAELKKSLLLLDDRLKNLKDPQNRTE